MSTLVMSACWPLQMPPTPKAVLISLADNANDHGYCWPSISKICLRTCFCKTAVIDAIVWLEQTGLLVADRSNGRHTKYQITLPAKDLFEPVKPERQSNRLPRATGPSEPADRSARTTVPVRQADTNRQEPSVTVKSDAPAPMLKTGAAAKAMIEAGIHHVNPSHPDIANLLAAGAPIDEFKNTAEEAVQKKKPTMHWVLATMIGRRRDAAEPLPAKKEPKPHIQDTSWKRARAGPDKPPQSFTDLAEKLGIRPPTEEATP